ncbi:hypothetical protein EOA60_05825 [Mesorhizobium sp. M1A.F.Ca.IN.020.06.1.1]|uniref:hypothetical protein n=1 Tax=unclassified Mesorhizobium TaxID=325217 RepID=UPI000FCB6A25|nr:MULTISPECIES: hypothetical protein [unclassified Mesorhizobium]RUV86919.1 hypothetical protein EOA51_13065 [Mesorhizobium sp. M1A.F.Ca.IN.020.32.1.1]RUW10555.1 hypothetical protein EOA46_14840 [Mesorhizobium sp. M1A.F.Ca.IN.022.05.2.1]RUW34603.1 hypothetical protein EOA60_05825 [Mesorhizobium sp. M1A.F.Ca.IN.020.06.1.1]RWF81637.1 MAG: hypothetical protein EOQ35_13170 [Mesorhizobium sp.]RWG02988.1 MAG: hypothetical protein EOQ38_09190 [Mesorhizobium sp.]
MPSTFTPNLNLELMATGEFSGTWGQRLDNNVFSILDAVLGNTLALPLTNVNVTLNTAQSQNNFIDLSGTLTGNVIITFPAIGRTYFIRNGTTGNFTVTLKTSAVGGATVVIQQGQSGFFALNGTDVLAVSNTLYSPTLTTPTVTGSLTVSSTDATAAANPIIDLFRDTASPAASDVLAQVQWNSRDSAANKQTYAADDVQITDPTSATRSAIRRLWSVISGALAVRFNIGAGLYSQGVTGGDKGAGTINAGAYYANGTALAITKIFDSGQQTITSGGALTLPHGLGVQPKLYMAVLQCVSAEGGFNVGDETQWPPNGSNDGSGSANGYVIVPDPTNMNIRFGNNNPCMTPMPRKDNGADFDPTQSKWKLVVRAWA